MGDYKFPIINPSRTLADVNASGQQQTNHHDSVLSKNFYTVVHPCDWQRQKKQRRSDTFAISVQRHMYSHGSTDVLQNRPITCTSFLSPRGQFPRCRRGETSAKGAGHWSIRFLRNCNWGEDHLGTGFEGAWVVWKCKCVGGFPFSLDLTRLCFSGLGR